jgi:hypothetical protein
VKKLRALWASLWGDTDRRVRLSRLLGLALIVIGFAVIAKAWDGAASKFLITEMFPYLLSGGFLGLSLVITGAMLIFLGTLRSERQLLSERYEEMATLLSRNLARMAMSTNGASLSGEQVVPGESAYHVPGCRVLEGKENLLTVPVEQAAAEGLAPCRVCDPPVVAETTEEGADKETQPAGSDSTSASDASDKSVAAGAADTK